MPGGNGRSGTAVFCENLVAICTHDRRLWIWISTENLWIWIWMANFISTASLFMRLLSDNADIEEDAQ